MTRSTAPELVGASVVGYGAASPIPEEFRPDAARLEVAAYAEPYATLGLPDGVALAVATTGLNLPATETEDLILITATGSPIALAAHCPASEARRRQLATVLNLCRSAFDVAPKEAAARLEEFRGPPAPATPGGFITRFAVAAEHRGKGWAERLMEAVQAQYPDQPLALHVRASNLPARRFYTRVGFSRVAEDGGTVLMERGAP